MGQGDTLNEHGKVIQGRSHLQGLSPTPAPYSPQHTAHHFRATNVILVDLERTGARCVWELGSAK